MCESKVLRMVDGGEERLMEGVARIVVQGEELVLTGMLGETRRVKARIKSIDAERHVIVVE